MANVKKKTNGMKKTNRTVKKKVNVTQQILKREIKKNPGLLGAAARALLGRKSQIDKYMKY